MKVLTFSRQFLQGHPKAGQPTFFVDKICTTLRSTGFISLENVALYAKYEAVIGPISSKQGGKHHTIRPGKRWKVGEMASLRVWSGKPYNSHQVEFARTRLINVYDISIGQWDQSSYAISINGKEFGDMDTLANNDGLSLADFQDWFPLGKTFDGQILCWSDKINY